LKKLADVLSTALSKKHWHNESQFCNTRTHPIVVGYRKYRRGKSRCLVCGAKIGKVKCILKSNRELLIDNIFSDSLFTKYIGETLNEKLD
jgi:hypothetical protein